jgi:uncharacterized protein YutE (UPF0331/DUF86 family)
MVHFYDEISDRELFEILSREMVDIEHVVAAILEWLAANPERVAERE